jgi:predicted methyltransferase
MQLLSSSTRLKILSLVALALTTGIALAGAPDPKLAAAVASPARDPKFVTRDPARHPLEELTFLGLKADQTVVELWPGGGYWTEILAPYLQAHGRYYVALPDAGANEEQSVTARWRQKIAAQPDRFGRIELSVLGHGHYEIAPAGSADLVLTFRNVHNWMGAGEIDAVLGAAFKALKPGGVLGVEGHRGRTDRPQDPKAESGYVRQDYMIELAKKAGFELVATSELLANPKDTKDWPEGVWTLPPTLTKGETDRAKYQSIGEADNFLLKFRKPAHAGHESH